MIILPNGFYLFKHTIFPVPCNWWPYMLRLWLFNWFTVMAMNWCCSCQRESMHYDAVITALCLQIKGEGTLAVGTAVCTISSNTITLINPSPLFSTAYISVAVSLLYIGTASGYAVTNLILSQLSVWYLANYKQRTKYIEHLIKKSLVIR